MSVNAPKLESYLGIEVYASKTRGIGGKIRSLPEDFIVEEVLADGSKASVQAEDKTALPSGHGRYLVCILVKKGWDTFAAVRKIAGQLGVSPERIGIAGLKDAQALTAQHLSIGGMPPARLLEVNVKDGRILPVRFSSEKISPKLLFGNQFNIMAKSIKLSRATIHKRIEETKNDLMDLGGVPNFFGHQRFGTVRPVTHQVGRCLVKGRFEEAAFIFLSETSRYEHPKAREARQSLRENRDFKTALRLFPRSLMYERLMVRHLSKHPNDFLGALNRLPLSVCVLFVQAYQSCLFNRFLSRRMRQNVPLVKAQVGDYAISLDEKMLPADSYRKVDESNISRINEEIGEHRMALALPMIGFRQQTSDGVEGEIEREILKEESISPYDFRIPKMPKASAAGGLRRALTPILDLSIEQKYDQNQSSVKFRFTLLKGSYATILLREFMKPMNLIKAGF